MNRVNTNGYLRVSKGRAKRIYSDGGVVYLCACKLRPGGPWGPEVAISKADGDFESARFVADDEEFERVINAFTYYNCRESTGRYPAYYIKTG